MYSLTVGRMVHTSGALMSHCTSCATAFVLDSTDVSIGRKAPFPPGAHACVHRQLGDGAVATGLFHYRGVCSGYGRP